MDFDLSEDQVILQETVDKYLGDRCPPSKVRELFDGDQGWDPEIWAGLVELGIAGLLIPEQYGGAGMEMLDLAIVAESLGHHATPGPFLEHALASLAIALGGSEDQKRGWLPRLANGDARATIALAEDGEAWQPEQWMLPAGEKLNGVKQHVPHAEGADLIVVGVEDGGLALVEGSASGIGIEHLEYLDRTRRLQRITLDGVPCELIENGSAVAPRVRDAGLVLLAADAYGGGVACAEASVEYAKTREQFGVKIGTFQGLKHQLANMCTEIYPTRGLYWYAAYAFDHVQDESPAVAALAKAHITDRFVQVARDTVEAHGGIGYTWECDLHFWLKRAVFDRVFLGDPEVHRRRAADLYDW